MYKDHSALVVDDDATSRLVFGKTLNLLGFSVDLAAGGAEAMEMLAAKEYSLVLVDMLMPDSDGCEVCKFIRNTEGKTARKRSVVLGVSASPHRELALSAGMDEFLLKPFLFDELKALVDKLIDH